MMFVGQGRVYRSCGECGKRAHAPAAPRSSVVHLKEWVSFMQLCENIFLGETSHQFECRQRYASTLL